MAYLVMLLCGIYYPVDRLPEPLLTIAKFMPLTYFLDELRTYYGFETLFQYGLIKGWLLNILYTFLGIWGAKTAISRAQKSGILLQLSE